MDLTWQHPYFCIGLLILPFFSLARRRTGSVLHPHSAPGRLPQRGNWLLLVLTAVALLILAAAGPAIRFTRAARHLVLLIDGSPAARTAPWNSPHALQTLLMRVLPANTRVTPVIFDRYPHVVKRDIRIDDTAAWPRRWPTTIGTCPKIDRALAWRSGQKQAAERHIPRWLFTTGYAAWRLPVSHNSGETSQPRKLTNAERLPYFLAISTVPAAQPDAGIASFTVHRANTDGLARRGFHIRALITATGPMHIAAQLRRNGVLVAERTIVFRGAGTKVFATTDAPSHLQAGAVYMMRLVTHDPWPEDDRAYASIPPSGPPHILLVSPEQSTSAGTSAQAGSGRATGNLSGQIWRVLPQAVPENVTALERFQLILLDNVARHDLSNRSVRAIEDYVTHTGGGLLIMGTSRAFGPGGYAMPDSNGHAWAIENLSPLASAPPQRRPKSVIFLMDSSGSMGQTVDGRSDQTRFGIAATALEAAVQLLRPADRATIITFSGSAKIIATGTVKQIGKISPKLLAQIIPTGPTNPDAALQLIRHTAPSQSLLILLTDGHIPAIHTHEWARLLTEKRDRLLVVAGYKHESPAFMNLLRQTRAEFTATHDPADWPAILRQSVSKYIAGHRHTSPLLWHSSTGHLSGTASRWVRTWLKRDAILTVTGKNPRFFGKKEIPLAAWRHCGLGRTGAAAFSARSRGFAAALRSMIQRLSARRRDPRFSIRTARVNGRWHVTVDARTATTFINHAALRLDLISSVPDGLRHNARKTYLLRQSAPGRYHLALPRQISVLNAVLYTTDSKENGKDGNAYPAGRHVIGHVHPAFLPPPCLPATGRRRPCPWKQVLQIPLSRREKNVWQPMLKQSALPLAVPLLLIAAILLMAGLYFLRVWQ